MVKRFTAFVAGERFQSTVESLELLFISLTLSMVFCFFLIAIVNRFVAEGW